MEYLLDTNFLIGFIRRNKLYEEKFLSINDGDLYISAITVTEIYAGCKPNEITQTEELLNGLVTIPVSKFIAKEAGKMIYFYSKRGKTIHKEDIIIGATARIHHLTLLTQNTKDFPMLYPSQIEKFPG